MFLASISTAANTTNQALLINLTNDVPATKAASGEK